MPQLVAILNAAGADLAAAVPAVSTPDFPVAQGDAPIGAHIMGGMRTGTDPTISVCDPNGRIHDLDNVFVTDASLFVTSGAVNPTLTLMAVALRNVVATSLTFGCRSTTVPTSPAIKPSSTTSAVRTTSENGAKGMAHLGYIVMNRGTSVPLSICQMLSNTTRRPSGVARAARISYRRP